MSGADRAAGPRGAAPAGAAGAAWFKSSHSNGERNCVEVAFLDGGAAVALRDSKDGGAGPVLLFTAEQWRAFLRRAGSGALGPA
ncbi:DUF397 domain-containing protein [Streptomyces capparidis]